MRFARMLVLALVAVCVVGFSTAADAQTGYVAVYFNEGMSIEQKNCPGPVLDTLTVGMVNWNMFVSGVQFKVVYPVELTHIADFNSPPTVQGATDIGYATGFPLPQNGFFPIKVCNVLVQWTCASCINTDVPVPVVGHPLLGGTISATQWPDNNKVNGLGLTALICATVPTEETTWGKVKSLYGE